MGRAYEKGLRPVELVDTIFTTLKQKELKTNCEETLIGIIR